MKGHLIYTARCQTFLTNPSRHWASITVLATHLLSQQKKIGRCDPSLNPQQAGARIFPAVLGLDTTKGIQARTSQIEPIQADRWGHHIWALRIYPQS